MDNNPNQTSHIIIAPAPTDDEAAALFAAITAISLVTHEAHPENDTTSHWQASRVLIHQQVALAHPGRRPAWQSIERLRRASPGSSGIVGL